MRWIDDIVNSEVLKYAVHIAFKVYLTVMGPCNCGRWFRGEFYNARQVYRRSFVDENVCSTNDFGDWF